MLSRFATLVVAAIGLAAALRPALAWASDDEPAAVPYRPSISTPAALSAPGWIEIEAGVQHEHDGAGAYRDSLPATIKLAFSPDWGVRLGADAWVRQRDGVGTRLSGAGDTSLVVKRRFAVDDANAFGLEAAALVPTASRGLGEGRAGYGVNAIYSGDFGRWHTDLNVVATRLGHADAGTSRLQWLGAASLSTSLDERWGVGAEVSGTNQRGVDATRQLLVATSYNVSKRLVLDAGLARSLRAGAPQWSAFTGFTWTATRLF
ncbi:MAG: transporter [Caldimonas sp.]